MTRLACVSAFAWLALLGMTLSACGDEVTTGEPATTAYEGPLHVTRDQAVHPGAGAAGDVVECTTWGSGTFASTTPYGSGATADSPAAALEVARSEAAFNGAWDGLLVAREEADRVLYVVEVDGVVKQAVIVHDGPATDGAGGAGWYVESSAHCDEAELPASYADNVGLQVWRDSEGRIAPTTRIASYEGPEHCDWQSMTFLYLDEASNAYVREPQADLGEFFRASYDDHAELPAGAVDTGYEHDGEHLWLAPDKGIAYVGTPDDVEAWPRTRRSLGCA